MDRFMDRQNVELYRRLRETRNADERLQIMKLLAEEKAKFKLEFQNREWRVTQGSGNYAPDRRTGQAMRC
jgi:hypothetical protein